MKDNNQPPISVPTESRQHEHNWKIQDHCAICGWTLAKSRNEGCVRGDCSQRPFPEKFHDFDRAEKEYGIKFNSKYAVDRQHNWECIAPENAYYRWQCQNPGCSETAPYPSDKVPNSPCMGSGRQLENGPNHDVGGAFLQEIRPEPESPSCHVCGSLTIPTEWKCVCCGTTTKPTASLPVGESRWISVEEKLPEDDATVLAAIPFYDRARKLTEVEVLHCTYWIVGGQKIFTTCEGGEYLAGDVTRWMPWPKPPELGLGTADSTRTQEKPAK